MEGSGQKARPRGLKRSADTASAGAAAAANKRMAGDAEGAVHEERIELPEELQDDDAAESDGYSLFNAALVEIGKDNLEVAAKFLEGAVHELQALYDAAEAPEQRLLHTLGMAWCELGVVAEQDGYMDRGLSFLRDAARAADSDRECHWDAARMLLGKHCLRHQDSSDAPMTAEETADVDEAVTYIDGNLAAATPEQLGEELLRAAELVHKYAQTQDADRLLQYAGKCEGYYCQYFDKAGGDKMKARAGRALNLTDMAEARMGLEQWADAEQLFSQALDSMRLALQGLSGQGDAADHAEYLKLMGEMHVHLGDVCAHMDRDEESEEHYRTAQAKVLEAKALWPQAVTDELVQTMEELVNGGGDDDDEVEEEEEEEEEEN